MESSFCFDECLALLLDLTDISVSRLAKILNVDSSLVNRWIRGKRIPPQYSAYTKVISEHIASLELNTFQMQHLHVLLKYFDVSNRAVSLESQIQLLLQEARGCSVEKMRRVAATEHEQKAEGTVIASIANEKSFSEHDRIIAGIPTVLECLLQVLTDALPGPVTGDGVIWIQYNASHWPFIDFSEFSRAFAENLRVMLKKGWKIRFLLYVGGNMEHLAFFNRFITPLVPFREFEIRVNHRAVPQTLGKDGLLVSGQQCVMVFPALKADDEVMAFHLKTPLAVALMEREMRSVGLKGMVPLVRHMGHESAEAYGLRRMNQEIIPGERTLIKDGLSLLLIPEELHESLLLRFVPTADQDLERINFRTRLNGFITNIQQYAHRDIYSMRSLDQLIRKNQFEYSGVSGMILFSLSTDEVAWMLQHILMLLDSQIRYEIAFSENLHAHMETYHGYSRVTKENRCLMVEAFIPGLTVPYVRYWLDDPLFVQATVRQFGDMWDGISSVHREKGHVMALLKDRLRSLQS